MSDVISFSPDDAVEGGFLDGVVADIEDLRWIEFDYNGNLPTPVLALQATYGVDQDGQHATFEQAYSAGDLARLAPSEDGTSLVLPEGSRAKGLTKSCNAMRWFDSLVKANFPKEVLAEGVTTSIIGTRVRLGREEFTNMGGGKTSLIVPVEIVDLPGDSQPAKPAARTTSRGGSSPKAPAPAPRAAQSRAAGNGGSSKANGKVNGKANGSANDNGADVKTLAAAAIAAVVKANGGKVQKAKLPQLVYQHVKDGNRNAIFQLAFQDAFLKSRSEFDYDGKTITLSEA